MKVRVSSADNCEKVRCFYSNFLNPTQPLSYMLLDLLTSKIAYFLPKMSFRNTDIYKGEGSISRNGNGRAALKNAVDAA